MENQPLRVLFFACDAVVFCTRSHGSMCSRGPIASVAGSVGQKAGVMVTSQMSFVHRQPAVASLLYLRVPPLLSVGGSFPGPIARPYRSLIVWSHSRTPHFLR